MTYLIGIGLAAVSTIVYLYIKKNSAEALNENIDTKNQINELDKDVSKNSGLLEAEEEKRKQLEKDANDQKAQSPSLLSLVDFFNKRK